MTYTRTTYIWLKSPAPLWKVADDMERLVEASFGPVWSELEKQYVALTDDFTKFQESDMPTLRAELDSYRGPVARVSIQTSGDIYSNSSAVLEGPTHVFMVTIYTSTENRVDAERIIHALAENLRALAGRKNSLWAGSRLNRGKLHQHVNAKEAQKPDGPSIVRARSIRVRFRRWIVLNRDSIIVSLATGLATTLLVILLQNVGVIPIPA